MPASRILECLLHTLRVARRDHKVSQEMVIMKKKGKEREVEENKEEGDAEEETMMVIESGFSLLLQLIQGNEGYSDAVECLKLLLDEQVIIDSFENNLPILEATNTFCIHRVVVSVSTDINRSFSVYFSNNCVCSRFLFSLQNIKLLKVSLSNVLVIDTPYICSNLIIFF